MKTAGFVTELWTTYQPIGASISTVYFRVCFFRSAKLPWQVYSSKYEFNVVSFCIIYTQDLLNNNKKNKNNTKVAATAYNFKTKCTEVMNKTWYLIWSVNILY